MVNLVVDVKIVIKCDASLFFLPPPLLCQLLLHDLPLPLRFGLIVEDRLQERVGETGHELPHVGVLDVRHHHVRAQADHVLLQVVTDCDLHIAAGCR